MINSFDTEVALDVGIKAAIIYKNIQHWCEYNRTNEKNFHDGLYWTFNSARAFKEQFPYLTEKQIRTSLETLEEKGYIKSGNFNKVGYDRTKWYADTGKGKSILPTGQMEVTCEANGSDTEGEPIPNINTDINTDVNTLCEPVISAETARISELFEQFWKLYPKKVKKQNAFREFKKIKNVEALMPIILDDVERKKRSKNWTKDNGQYIPDPERYIKNERWNDVNEVAEKQMSIEDAVSDKVGDFF